MLCSCLFVSCTSLIFCLWVIQWLTRGVYVYGIIFKANNPTIMPKMRSSTLSWSCLLLHCWSGVLFFNSMFLPPLLSLLYISWNFPFHTAPLLTSATFLLLFHILLHLLEVIEEVCRKQQKMGHWERMWQRTVILLL